MKIEDLKKQFEEIEQKVDAGESVQINLNEGGKSIRLAVDESGAEDISDLESAESAGDDAAGQQYNFNLSGADVSDGEIAGAIDDIRPLESLSDLPDVVLTKNENGWVLYQDCTYKTGLGYEITAVKGFETDLASIPRLFWALLSSDELSLAAPVFHDLLYRCGGALPGNQLKPSDGKKFERKEVDGIFLEIMETADIPKWKREIAYRAVRTFAGFAWQG